MDRGDPMARTAPSTCSGQGHAAVLLLVGGTLVGTCRGDGESGGSRQGAATTVQFSAGTPDNPIVVGEERKLWGDRTVNQSQGGPPAFAGSPIPGSQRGFFYSKDKALCAWLVGFCQSRLSQRGKMGLTEG